jgi:hypothetical protein
MSTLWTPGGERPIRREPEPAAPAGAGGPGDPDADITDEELLARMQAELARTPASVVVANHAFGLFELAALHLSLQPPQLEDARLAIDALTILVEGLGDRLGDHSPQLAEGLAQLRMAYVQIHAASGQGQGQAPEAG